MRLWRTLVISCRAILCAAALACASPLALKPAHGAPSLSSPVETDLARGACLDLIALYRAAMPGAAGDSVRESLAACYEHSGDSVRRARLRGDLDSDGRLDGTWSQNAALLLRLRTLSLLSERLGRDAEGLTWCAEAESLASHLQISFDESMPEDGALVALAAGLEPRSTPAARLRSALREIWRERLVAPHASDSGWRDLLLLQVLVPSDPQVLEAAAARPPRDAWDAALHDVARAVLAGDVSLLDAGDPGLRLRLGVGALVRDGALPAWTEAVTGDLALNGVDSQPAYAAARAALDSLRAALDDSLDRAVPIRGSRRDYYRARGETAPSLAPDAGALARRTARGGLEALRARLGARVLRRLGLSWDAEVDPSEVVPGQMVCALWGLKTRGELRFERCWATIGGAPVEARPALTSLAAGDSALLRTGFAPLAGATPGEALAPVLRLGFRLEGWGDVEIEERVPVRVVGPVQAELSPVGGPLVQASSPKGVEICVTSRSPERIAGTLRVLATSDWSIEPARSFQFQLRRPGESVRQRIDLALPGRSSPGVYDVAVRLEVNGSALGTLQAQLVKPVEWVVAGPFAPPAPGAVLPPERGFGLQARYRGRGGEQIAWQVVPAAGYAADGAVDFAALFPEAAGPPGACACAFTVFESPDAGLATLRAAGAARVLWNGCEPGPHGEVRLVKGRNALVVRSGSTPEGWRLHVELGDVNGAPLRSVANDVARLVDGFDALAKAPVHAPLRELADRIVTVSVHAPAAGGVAVLGAFDAWVPLDLQRQPDGSWQRELHLAPGRYAYKLLVDGHLRPDPGAAAFEADGFGGRNSLLIVR